MTSVYRTRYFILKLNTVATFYFFALTQKSNKKSQGFEKMAKNYFVNLNPANSPLYFYTGKILLAQTTPAF